MDETKTAVSENTDETNEVLKKDYEARYREIQAYEEKLHAENQHRIRVGIRLNPILPLVFLILSFANSDSKLIFLILWIISLFGIAGYLIYVEYTDYVLQEKMKEFGFRDEDEKNDVLLGHSVAAASDAVIDRTVEIDEKIEETKQDIRERIDNRRMAAKEMISEGAETTKEIIGTGTEKAIETLGTGKEKALEKLGSGKEKLLDRLKEKLADKDSGDDDNA